MQKILEQVRKESKRQDAAFAAASNLKKQLILDFSIPVQNLLETITRNCSDVLDEPTTGRVTGLADPGGTKRVMDFDGYRIFVSHIPVCTLVDHSGVKSHIMIDCKDRLFVVAVMDRYNFEWKPLLSLSTSKYEKAFLYWEASKKELERGLW